MTTRDPRSRAPKRPSSAGGRDPTQSLSLPPDEAFVDEPSHPSLALGTADAHGVEQTRIESPGARSRTPAPPKATKPPPLPPRTGPDEPERVGVQLGSYKVLELLGKGGMGYVYRAEHSKLGREVALKLLRSDYARRRDAVARFFQEARTVNRVRHRNIVDVTDFVELDDGTTFIIMEFLRGQNLGKWARTGIDLPRALAVLVQICDGLGAAHQVGVVHRDLKPDNIIVVPTSDGAELVKLLDFGVAKLLNRDDEDIGFQTAAGSVIGTPAYMSPEQAGGMVIDARSDIYALGAIMYELFCGQPMFRGRSFGEYVRKHLTEMPVPPRATEQGRGMDPGLELVILKCLAKDPDQRFGTILELRDALLGMLDGIETHPPGYVSLNVSGVRPLPLMSGIRPRAASVGSHPSGHVAASYYSDPGYSQLPPAPSQLPAPWWVWFVGGAVAVALGVGAAVWYANRDADKPVAVVRHPLATPIEAPARASSIELRFDSLPSGGVYAEGQSGELCTTPCTANLALEDALPKRRAFIVKRPGYKDGRIDVDLEQPQREYRVTLDREATVTDVKVVSPATEAAPTVEPDDDAKLTKKKVGAVKVQEPADEPPSLPAVEDKPEAVDVETPPPAKKPNKIDVTETLDPFRKK